MTDTNFLRDRWLLNSESALQQLLTAYSSPERHYHTAAHLYHVLCTIEQLHPTPSISLNLAAWFHDAVYNSRANDNEAKSADLAEEILRSLSIEPKTIAQVRRLILSTQTHQAFDRESEILLDADLAILGADSVQYQNYAAAIRHEYSWVTAEAYRDGRTKVLQNFLQRDRIYYTTQMQARAAIARQNLRSELELLQNSCF